MSLDYLKWSSLLVFLEGLSVNLMILAVWRVLYCCTLLSMVKMESMTVEDVAEWLKDHGFGDDVQEAFRGYILNVLSSCLLHP